MRPSSAKAKGREFQQEIAAMVSELLGLPWGYDECIAPREMGQSGVDIRLVGEAKKRFPWSVECKRSERINVPAWVEQARDNKKIGTEWVLFARQNRRKAIAILDAEVFFKLLSLLPHECKGCQEKKSYKIKIKDRRK